ncbi:conserved hypothetical protein [Aeromonas salmonicida]|nr:conserved hypothetical protein [Aeromonas salmonicida]
MRNNPVSRAAPVGHQVSLRVCEMEAEVRVFMRDRSVPVSAVAKELQQVIAERCHQSIEVMGTSIRFR